MTNLYYLQKTPKLSTELAAIGTADNLNAAEWPKMNTEIHFQTNIIYSEGLYS